MYDQTFTSKTASADLNKAPNFIYLLTIIYFSCHILYIRKKAISFNAMQKSKKIPIQIYLDPDQFRMIDLLSKARSTSKAATIRECIAEYFKSIPLENDPALKIINLGASGNKDIAAKHDDYLNEYQTRGSE
jgi:hypothetical protein